MRRSVLPVVLALLLVLPLGAVGPAAATPSHDGTTIEIEIQPNGDAVWTVAARYNLSTANDTAAFERLRSEFETGDANVGLSADLFREAAARVAQRTGRDMAIANVNRSSRLTVANGSQVGVLSLRFTWTNFAVVEGEVISVGSAFEGGWFGDLAATQTLRIAPPSGYGVETAQPSTGIVGGTLQWEGPQAFGPGQPAVEFAPPASPTTPTTPPPENGIPWAYTAIGFVGLVIAGILLVAWQGGYLGGGRAGSGSDEQPGPGDGDAAASGSAARRNDSSPDSGPATEPATEPEEATGEPTGDREAAADVDTDLLSDEERVEHILQEHGGRMKQAQIVEETRWSNAKVSQLLSAMAEEGRVQKLRIGRENLISLPEYDDES